MLNSLVISLPKARYIVHLSNVATVSNIICFAIGLFITLCFCNILDKDDKENKKYKTSTIISTGLCICFAAASIFLLFGCTLPNHDYTQDAINYNKAQQIRYHHKNLQATSRLGLKYGRLMTESKYRNKPYNPQWWMYL